jgi:hypothetical protein
MATSKKQPRFNLALRNRGYVFTVALLASIAIGLLLFRPRGATQVVESQLTYVIGERTSSDGIVIDPSATSAITEHILGEIRDPEFLQAATEAADISLEERGETADQIALNLHAFVKVDHGGLPQMRLRFVSDDRDFAIRFLAAVGKKFQTDHDDLPPPTDDGPDPNIGRRVFAEATTKQWKQRSQELLEERQQLIDAQLAKLKEQHRHIADAGGLLQQVAPKPAPEFDARPQANPAWISLREELTTAQQKAKKLLETHTPEHPSVLQLLTDIEAIRQELQETSRTTMGLAGSTSGSDQSTTTGPPATTQSDDDTFAPPTRVVAKEFDEAEARQTIFASEAYLQLEAKIKDAKNKLAQAEQHLAKLPAAKQQPATVTPFAPQEICRIEIPARVVEVMRPPFTAKNLLSLLGPASLIGLGLALGRQPTRLPAFLCSEEDVETTLGLPIISSVAQPAGPVFEVAPNRTPMPVIFGIRLAEAILVASILLIVMGLVTLPDFASQFTSNPFNAFCIGLDHLESFFTS